WNGPLPWLDHHGAAPQDAPALAEHLQRYHMRAGRLVVPPSGWHIHWVLPPCPDEDAPVPVDEPFGEHPAVPHSLPAAAAACVAGEHGTIPASLRQLAAIADWPPAAVATPDSTAAPHHRTAVRSRRAPLIELCVLLC
ncbi:MAG: hypothetical protein D6725_06080, partial [Planctomycetota bacterium]